MLKNQVKYQVSELFLLGLQGGTAAPWWAWVRKCVPPQQILSLHVKCAGPQF